MVIALQARFVRYMVVALLIIISMIIIGCKKTEEALDKLTQFTFGVDYTIKVPPSPFINIPFGLLTPEIDTHSEEMFNQNKTRADMVEEINLEKLDLTVLAPDGGTFKFLKSVDINAVAEGLPEVRVAYKDLVPDNVGNTLSLDVTGAELKEYFKKDKYQLRITVVADEEIPVEYTIRALGTFFVDAKVLGN